METDPLLIRRSARAALIASGLGFLLYAATACTEGRLLC
jgi:hypothetical protein